MAAIESVVGVAEGTPTKNLHTLQRSVSAVNVEDQIVLLGESVKATYTVIASAISTATSSSHVLQIMAGGTLYTRLERISIKQVANAGAVAMLALQVFRLTSAGTGGSAVTARPLDGADSAFSGAAMTLPSSKGTEGVQLDLIDFPLRAAILGQEQHYIWTPPLGTKPIILGTGTSNGIAFKVATGVASATISIVCVVSETSYL